VLCAAQTNALGAVGAGTLGILGIIGVCPNLQALGGVTRRTLAHSIAVANLIRPFQQGKQVGLLFQGWYRQVHFSCEDFAGTTIKGNPIPFVDDDTAGFHQAFVEVNPDGGCTHHARHAKLAGNDGCMGGRAAFAG